MLKKLCILITSLLTLSISLSAQIINSDYQKIKTITRVADTHNQIPLDMIMSKDKSLLAISYGAKPSQIEVYSMERWERISNFSIKGFINQTNSYFSGTEENILHIAQSKGRKMYKVNFRTNEIKSYQLSSTQSQGGGSGYPHNSFYRDFWEQTGSMDHYRFFDDYVLIITDTTIEVYQK